MIDVNMGWSADVAIQMGRKFEAYDVYWLEEPVVADDFAGYMRIAEALDLRIVGGGVPSASTCGRSWRTRAADPARPDPMRGGFTDLRKTATLADTWGMSLARTCSQS